MGGKSGGKARGEILFQVKSALEDAFRRQREGPNAWQWGKHRMETQFINRAMPAEPGQPKTMEYVGYEPLKGSLEVLRHAELVKAEASGVRTDSVDSVAQFREPTIDQKAKF